VHARARGANERQHSGAAARGISGAIRRAVRTHLFLGVLLLGACTIGESEDENATSGVSVTIDQHLSGCHGQASSSIPSSGSFVLTTFGGPGDHQSMSCGGFADGTGWYAASRQRYGCGAHIKIEANGKCVVVETDDYGPDVCVENAAGSPIIDASPRVSQALFGESGAGWSDHMKVTVTQVAAGTPVGPCATGGGGGGGGGGGTTGAACNCATLARDVPDGTCVQSATDADWYTCTNGAWVARASASGCASAYGWCTSATLGEDVPPRTCVQSGSSGIWYQCNGQTWASPVSTSAETGPLGACSSWHPR
jgi:hypothetical protein